MVASFTRDRVWCAKPGAFHLEGLLTLGTRALQFYQGKLFHHASSREDDPSCERADPPRGVGWDKRRDRRDHGEYAHGSGGTADPPTTSPHSDARKRLGRLEAK